ncbi:MAG: DNA polymerase III subunit beta [Candidatus Moranbacteria bacterium]|nr:DNA polymerase III subunit beta [Candidatus Moranbacteria bacterium]
MKITVIKDYLTKALHILSRVVRSSGNLPVLSSVYFEVKNNKLTLKATNLEIGVIYSIGASVEKKGEVAIPLRVLNDVVDGVVEKKIKLEKKGDSLRVKTKSIDTEIKGLDIGDFPIIPKVEKGRIFSLDNQILSKAIEQVIPSMAISNMRPDLSSVFIKTNSDIRVVATDGFRLGEKIVTSADLNKKQDPNSIILPGQSASEIMYILSQIPGVSSIILEESQIAIKSENLYIVSRIIDGNYPDYTQIIPKEFKTTTIIDRKEFLNSVKLASIFSGKDMNDVLIEVNSKKKKIIISSQSKEVGKGVYEIKGEIKGGDVKIILNHRYLVDGLNSIQEQNVELYLNKEDTPILIKPFKKGKKSNFLYLLSPIKKQ